MLTLGWSDGISFLPVSCAMLASNKEKNRLVPLRTDLDCGTNGARRRQEGIRKATDVLVEMVAEAIASGIKAKHFLFDLMFLEQAMGAATEMTREIIRSLIDQFLRDLPPIYGARWLLA